MEAGDEEKIKRHLSVDLGVGNRVDSAVVEAWMLGNTIGGVMGSELLVQSARLADLSVKYMYYSDDFDIRVNPGYDQLTKLIAEAKEGINKEVVLAETGQGMFGFSLRLREGGYEVDMESSIRGYGCITNGLRTDVQRFMKETMGINDITCDYSQYTDTSAVRQMRTDRYYKRKIDHKVVYRSFDFYHEDQVDEWAADIFYFDSFTQAKGCWDKLVGFLSKSKE